MSHQHKKMHKRFAFEGHHNVARAQGFYPPGVTPESGSVPHATTTPAATTPAAPGVTTPPADTHPPTTANTAATNPLPDTKADAHTTSSTPATTANTSSTGAATTTGPGSAPPTVTHATTPAAHVQDTEDSNYKVTVTRTTKAPSSIFPSSSTSALPSAAADDGPGLGSIAGMAAAAIAGIAVISIFAIWMIRRKRRRADAADLDAAPFNRQSWLRNSTMIPDDAPTPGSGLPPRHAPEMIDRSYNATPVSNYGGMNNFGPPANTGFNYATQPSYQPGAVIFSPSSANTSFGPGGGPATPLPFSPGYGTPNPFEGQGQEAGYTELTRGGPPSPMTPYDNNRPVSPRAPSPPNNANGGDAAFNRLPAYPELSPALANAQKGQVVEVRESTYEGRATPVQYGFADAAAPKAQPQAAGRPLVRPETVYDPEDAYGGI